MNDDKIEVIDPSLSQWQYFAVEDSLREKRNDVPNLRLANTMRRYLAGVVLELSDRHGLVGWLDPKDLDVAQIRQLAMTQIGSLAVRSASASLTLVASGYEPEATVHLRRLIECTLRSRAVLEDRSGQHARQWLVGRARPSAERLAQRYGTADDLSLLSISAHADSRGLAMLSAPDLSADSVPTIPLFPHRDLEKARTILYGTAYECGMVSAGLAEAFDVAVRFPIWAGQELRAARAVALKGAEDTAEPKPGDPPDRETTAG